MELGELIVLPGTNEVAIVTKKSGKGLFSERFKNGTLGELEIIGKIPEHLAELYWNRKEGNHEE